MTIPTERTRAVLCTRQFLRALLDPKQTPKVPRAIRKWAYRCLRHYPHTYDLVESAGKVPRVWGEVDKEDLDL